jgi:hypothetical protein
MQVNEGDMLYGLCCPRYNLVIVMAHTLATRKIPTDR